MPRHRLERLPPHGIRGPGPARVDLPHQRRPRLGGEAVFRLVVPSVRVHGSTVARFGGPRPQVLLPGV
jgi:hypothetical protein